MKSLTATHIAYYHLCHRKLWLFSHGLQMEHTSALVAEGKLIDEHTYQRRAERWQELQIGGIKIDHFDVKRSIVREVKKSNKEEQAHVAQLKYYLFVLEQNGVEATGLLEYPKLHKTAEVRLEEEDREMIPEWEQAIEHLVGQEEYPPAISTYLCKKCAYRDFCYSHEID